MKEKILEKAEMKESLLSGEALALNDAELEGAAGGRLIETEANSRGQLIVEAPTPVYDLDFIRQQVAQVIEQKQTSEPDIEQPQMPEPDPFSERLEAWRKKQREAAGIP